MSEPEIARRCPTCGASIREAALFCPQCGNGLPQGASQTQPLTSAEQKITSGRTWTERDHGVEVPQEAPASEPAKASLGQAALGAVGAKIQRATNLARDVEGDVMHRARKVREISSVVLDEAGYDPSLRFVLVAVVLFVLFLIIVLLNKFIT
jgi:hypothetical protein